ncbi:hypothetical protein [Geothermobacter hydrogeniphilus]|uniref:hypothetical protein n=1 Tax=Geothermobacter hydrogeniphilus TaxID=1969733 RepID=UPI0015538B96|nr:hypothetical protein [Geothermobacter hydrogeniphilus]
MNRIALVTDQNANEKVAAIFAEFVETLGVMEIFAGFYRFLDALQGRSIFEAPHSPSNS